VPSRPLRVAIDARYLTGESGGVISTVGNLLRAMALLEPGLEPLLLVRDRAHLSALPPLRHQAAVYPRHPHDPRSLHGLTRAVDLGGWPLFHSPYNVLPRRVPTRTLLTVHDLMGTESPGNLSRHPLWRLAVRWWAATYVPDSLRRADRVIAVSRTTRDAIRRLFPEAAGKVEVVPNGVDPSYRPLDPGEALRLTREVEPAGRGLVLVVGNASPHKNHYRAVQAYLRAFGGRDDLRLVLVRRFPRWDRPMRALLASPEAARAVIVLPAVPAAVLHALYCRARVFLFPSWVEGFGLPILEAMACGTPVVTSSVSAPAEVAGDAALLADPFDVEALAAALRRAEGDAGLRRDLVARGLARAAQFPWERAARRTLEIYRELAAR